MGSMVSTVLLLQHGLWATANGRQRSNGNTSRFHSCLHHPSDPYLFSLRNRRKGICLRTQHDKEPFMEKPCITEPKSILLLLTLICKKARILCSILMLKVPWQHYCYSLLNSPSFWSNFCKNPLTSALAEVTEMSVWNILLRNHSHCPSVKQGISSSPSLHNLPIFSQNCWQNSQLNDTKQECTEIKQGQGSISPLISFKPTWAESTTCKSCVFWGSERSGAINNKLALLPPSFQGGIKTELRICFIFISCFAIKGNNDLTLPLHVSPFKELQS